MKRDSNNNNNNNNNNSKITMASSSGAIKSHAMTYSLTWTKITNTQTPPEECSNQTHLQIEY